MSINAKKKTDNNNSSNTTIRGNNNNTETINPSEDNIVNDQSKLELLRVARHELSSGNTTGSVFIRLSSGAVAFPIDRSTCQARVDRIIVQTVESLENKESS